MARGLPFTYGPSRTALESSTACAMGVVRENANEPLISGNRENCPILTLIKKSLTISGDILDQNQSSNLVRPTLPAGSFNCNYSQGLMSNLEQEAKGVTEASTRFLPNPKLLVTVLLWTMAFIYLTDTDWDDISKVDEWYDRVTIISWVALIIGTAVIGLEKLIDRVDDPAGPRLCAMLVSGVLGFLMQIVMNIYTVSKFIDNGDNVDTKIAWLIWIRAVFGTGLGLLLYAVPSLAEMAENMGSGSSTRRTNPNSSVGTLNKMNQQADTFLPNPKVLATVLIWTVAFEYVLGGVFGWYGWPLVVALVGGTAVIGLEKLINRVNDPAEVRLCAMLVAGFLGFLIQIAMNLRVLQEVRFIIPYNFVGNNSTELRILRVVFGCLFGILYVMSLLTDTVEKRRKKASPVTTFLQEVAQMPIA